MSKCISWIEIPGILKKKKKKGWDTGKGKMVTLVSGVIAIILPGLQMSIMVFSNLPLLCIVSYFTFIFDNTRRSDV